MEKIKELQELLQMENVKDAKERFKEIAKMLFQDFHQRKTELTGCGCRLKRMNG